MRDPARVCVYSSHRWVQAPLGSIRASLGWMSTFEDVYAFADFVAKYKDLEEYE